jgi:hypothetical protein
MILALLSHFKQAVHWTGVLSLCPGAAPHRRAMVEGQTVPPIRVSRPSLISPGCVKFLSLPSLCLSPWGINLPARAIMVRGYLGQLF